jgi:hypothetical protein
MLLLIAAQLALAAPPAGRTPIYSYRGADGSEHFVGRLEDVPPAQRQQAREVDLSGWSSNPGLAEGMKRAKEDEIRHMTPSLMERAGSQLQAAADASRLHPGRLTQHSWFPLVALAILLLVVQASFFAWVIFNRPRAGWLLIPTFLAVVAAVGCGFYLWTRPGGGFPQELDPLEAATNARRVRDEYNKMQQQRDQDIDRAFNPPEAQRTAPPPGQVARPTTTP